MTICVFLSSVTDRSASANGQPDPLRKWLDVRIRGTGIHCIHQEFLLEQGTNTLRKLADEIARCDVVIHLVGVESGKIPNPEFVPLLFQHLGEQECRRRLPVLFQWDITHECYIWNRLTYTQWEAWLAIYYGRKLVICGYTNFLARFQTGSGVAFTNNEHLQCIEPFGGRAVQCATKHKLLDHVKTTLIRHLLPHHQVTAKVSWPNPSAPPESHIANRQHEVQWFLELLSDHCQERVLLLDGPSNRGKSTLLREFERIAMSLNPIITGFVDLKGGVSLLQLLGTLVADLEKNLHFPCFKSALAQNNSVDASIAFIEDLKRTNCPVVLFIDTYEDATRDCREWVEAGLLYFVRKFDAISLVVAGHFVPSPPSHWQGIAHRSAVSRIVDSVHWCRYRDWLGIRDVTDEEISEVVLVTDGNASVVNAFITHRHTGVGNE
jgi:hypothetical protein